MEVVVKMVVEISTWTEFDAMRNAPSNDYKLVNDLTETDANYSSVADPWDAFSFTGTFDGQGYSVGPITGSSDGLFNSLSSSAVFENVTVDVDISISQSVVGFSYYIEDGATVRDVDLTGSINTDNGQAFGFANIITNTNNNDTTVKNCTISADVTTTSNYDRGAGICDEINSLNTPLQNVSYTGTVTSDDESVGIALKILGGTDLDQCTVSGTVDTTTNGSSPVAGISVSVEGPSNFTGCSVTGTVKHPSGNVIGMIRLSESPSTVTIDNCTVNATLETPNTVSYAVGDSFTSSSMDLTVKNSTFNVSANCQSDYGIFFGTDKDIDTLDIRNNNITIPSTTSISRSLYYTRCDARGNTHYIRNNQVTIEAELSSVQVKGFSLNLEVSTQVIHGNDIDCTVDRCSPEEARLIGDFNCKSGSLDVYDNSVTANELAVDSPNDSIYPILGLFVNDSSADVNVYENICFINTVSNMGAFIKANETSSASTSTYDIYQNAFITGVEFRLDKENRDIQGLIEISSSSPRAEYNYCIHPGLYVQDSQYPGGIDGFGQVNENADVAHTYTLLGACQVPVDGDSELTRVRGFNSRGNNGQYNDCVSTVRPIEDVVPYDIRTMPLNAFFGDAVNYSSTGEFDEFNIDFSTNEWQLVEEGVPVDGYLPLNDGPPILADLDTKAQFEAFSKTRMFDFDFDELKTLTGNVTIDGVDFENAEVYVIDSNRNFLAGPLSTDQNGQVTVDLPGDGYIAYILIDFEDAGQRFARAKSINFDTSA